jgi:hypothetical protein
MSILISLCLCLWLWLCAPRNLSCHISQLDTQAPARGDKGLIVAPKFSILNSGNQGLIVSEYPIYHCKITMVNAINHQKKVGTSLVPIGLALLVMVLSLTAVAIVYISFGHLPGYASKILELQQTRLRQQYGLPPARIITDPKILQIPPSLRDMLSAYYNNPK